ncbi:acyl carrier protein [Bowmanella denitrificans]|uniref:acyl carrier protein n=1 Tax=Bowmanella denitrificans TaxID=366582 RepID=UPI000C9D25D4|nr:acyl carrier protein [Bowmanella denitrificans]
MEVQQRLAEILGEILARPAQDFQADTLLLGAIAEFDSMALMMLITELELRFDVDLQDADFDAETFSDMANLSEFIQKSIEYV